MTATAMPIYSWNWEDQGTSFRRDTAFLLLALLLHLPLIWVKLQSVGQASTAGERLESVDFVEETPLPPLSISQAPAPERSFMEKVTHFFKPPPPVPTPRVPESMVPEPPELARPEIKAPLLQVPAEEKIKPLTGKSAFQEKISAGLKPQENDLLSTPVVAPIKIGKAAAPQIRVPSVQDKGSFHVAQSELPTGISDNLPPTAPGAAATETIQIPTARHASAENPSAVPAVVDRGSYAGPSSAQEGLSVPSSGLQGSPSIPSRLVTPAIPIDARSNQGNGNVGKTFQERSGSAAPIVVPNSVSAGSSPSLVGSSAISASGSVAHRPQRSLFQITGELANRKIIFQKLPAYPAWAQAKGISAMVVLDFMVSPDGNVLADEIIVKRTSGYEDLDDRAVEALKQWKFVQLSADSNQIQAGTIVFTYALR